MTDETFEQHQERNLVFGKKAKYYKDKNNSVHITLKNKTKWYNGFIKEIGSDFLIIHDKRLGDMVIFFLELDDIEPYEEKGGVERSFYQA